MLNLSNCKKHDVEERNTQVLNNTIEVRKSFFNTENADLNVKAVAKIRVIVFMRVVFSLYS